jgi:hypothetical protein
VTGKQINDNIKGEIFYKIIGNRPLYTTNVDAYKIGLNVYFRKFNPINIYYSVDFYFTNKK